MDACCCAPGQMKLGVSDRAGRGGGEWEPHAGGLGSVGLRGRCRAQPRYMVLVLTPGVAGRPWVAVLLRKLGSGHLPRVGDRLQVALCCPAHAHRCCHLTLPAIPMPHFRGHHGNATLCFCFLWACYLLELSSCLVPSPLFFTLVLLETRVKADTKHPPSRGVVRERDSHLRDRAAVEPCRAYDHRRMVALVGWVSVPGASPCHLLQQECVPSVDACAGGTLLRLIRRLAELSVKYPLVLDNSSISHHLQGHALAGGDGMGLTGDAGGSGGHIPSAGPDSSLPPAALACIISCTSS